MCPLTQKGREVFLRRGLTMTTATRWWRRMAGLGRRPLTLATLLLAGSVFLPPPALAALGGSQEDLLQDAAALRLARMTITSGEGFDVHEMTSADGTSVRAYVEPGGRVFAVSWSGSVQPDLRVVLGPYYPRYLDAARAPHSGHHVVSLTAPDLVLSVVKLPRGFAGHARLPSLVPAGTAVDTLR